MASQVQSQESRGIGATVLSVAFTVLATACHFWAGWQDEGRLVLQPVGHLTVLAAAAWLVAIVVAMAAVLLEPRLRRVSGASLAVAVLGLGLLFVHF